MATLRVGDRTSRVTVDLPTEALVRRTLDRVAPGLVRVVEAAADDVAGDARARWPVKTGESKAGLEAVVTVAPGLGSIRGSVLNAVPYAVYIRARSLGGRSAVVELLSRPIRARAPRLAEECARVAAEVLGGR